MTILKIRVKIFPTLFSDCSLNVESMYDAVSIAIGAKIGMRYKARFVDAMLKKIIPAKNQHFAKSAPFSREKLEEPSGFFDFEKAWKRTGMRRMLHGKKLPGNSIM